MSWSLARVSALCDEAQKLGMHDEACVLADNLYRIVDGLEAENLDWIAARVREATQRKVASMDSRRGLPRWLDVPSEFRALVT